MTTVNKAQAGIATAGLGSNGHSNGRNGNHPVELTDLFSAPVRLSQVEYIDLLGRLKKLTRSEITSFREAGWIIELPITNTALLGERPLIEAPVAYVDIPWNSGSTALANRMGLSVLSFFPIYGPPGDEARQDMHAVLSARHPVKTLSELVEAAGYSNYSVHVGVLIRNPFFRYEGMRHA